MFVNPGKRVCDRKRALKANIKKTAIGRTWHHFIKVSCNWRLSRKLPLYHLFFYWDEGNKHVQFFNCFTVLYNWRSWKYLYLLIENYTPTKKEKEKSCTLQHSFCSWLRRFCFKTNLSERGLGTYTATWEKTWKRLFDWLESSAKRVSRFLIIDLWKQSFLHRWSVIIPDIS